MKKENVIKALNEHYLHLINCCHAPCQMETELCCPTILFNEIELMLIFEIEITQMTMRLDQLLKLGMLKDEIRLQKKNVPTIAVSTAREAMKTRALGEKVFLRP